MPYPGYTNEEVGRRGEEIYQTSLRAEVEKDNVGKFLVLDIVSGDYEIADEDVTASDRILERRPNGILYGVRIGFPTAYRLGGGSFLVRQ